MSRSTRSRAIELAWIVVAAIAAMTAMPMQASPVRAPALPPSVSALAPGLTAQGGGELTFFGISVYDGWYWSAAGGWPQDGPYALDLIYHRDLDGDAIAKRSIEEIAKLGYGSTAQRARWRELLAGILPDVRRGDRLTGVSLRTGAVRYFHNGAPIGEIAEPGFAQAFFGIWLDPKSSRADFRQKLLGAP